MGHSGGVRGDCWPVRGDFRGGGQMSVERETRSSGILVFRFSRGAESAFFMSGLNRVASRLAPCRL